ncbi:MAG: HAD-IIIA family hydrolase [Spirochaetaceae bacterium]|jgi:D-glycero-D-manno-heptose 1,7-bisphosphate phosphatase|nr:HAD-IIIA family hydrolase [Spirochaetaceae bacterium]
MKTVIMAGGKGTRIASVARDIPKPMIKLWDKPILEYQIESLKRSGLDDIIIVIGHLGHIIKDYFGDGKKFGCSISYYEEESPLGTAGALYKIKDDLGEDFILLCGDIIFDIDFKRFIEFHREKKALAALVAHPNSHPYDSSLFVVDKDMRITQWLHKEDPRTYYKNLVNAGLHIINKKLLDDIRPQTEKVDLDRDLLKAALPSGRIFAYRTPEYAKDMGTPERYDEVLDDIKNGLVQARNLSQPQSAIFLDRDGTINKSAGFVHKLEDFILLPGASEAIKKINNSRFLAIVITNQPVIARGELDIRGLEEIHNKMETLLGEGGAYLNDIFYCPHHPDKGFAGERIEYKIDCACRKPKPGMLLQAAEKYNINLGESWMVGDSEQDCAAGRAAGCKTAYIGDSCGTSGADMSVPSLFAFTAALFGK